ncbi:MAG TPA: low temperature requirement protein A [Galbitalea sp.]|jgi:low temperature requirement protein LtrA
MSQSTPETGAFPSPHRAADWYELFFDLVFVVVIAVSAETIEADTTAPTVLVFILLLFPLWWAWVNLMITNNLFGERFPVIGALVVAAMPGPAAMAIAISVGADKDAWLYALGAAWIRVVLLVMWLIPFAKNALHLPLWRLLLYNVGTGLLWVVSLWLPAPWNYLLWAVAVLAEVALLAIRRGFSYEVYQRASVSHSLDRVGLFVVIVIGEAVYLAVTGLSQHPTGDGGAAGLAGLLVCALLARAFFRWGVRSAEAGLVAAQRSNSYGAMRDVIMYLPFILVVALTLVAASIGIAVVDASDPLPLAVRTILACGIGGFYLTNAIIGLRLGRNIRYIGVLLIPGLGLPALACFATGGLAAWGTLALAALGLVLLDAASQVLDRRGHAH